MVLTIRWYRLLKCPAKAAAATHDIDLIAARLRPPWLRERLEFGKCDRQIIRDRRMNVHGALDNRVLRLSITGVETIFRSSTGNMDRVSTRHERLCRGATCIHACAAKFMTFDNGLGFAGTRKPRRQARARPARPNNDYVKVLRRSGQRVPSTWILPCLAASSGVSPS